MMLPAFRIKNLPPIAAPNTRAYDGRIEISEAEYDTLCLWHPVARLKYTHEDGEIVTVCTRRFHSLRPFHLPCTFFFAELSMLI